MLKMLKRIVQRLISRSRGKKDQKELTVKSSTQNPWTLLDGEPRKKNSKSFTLTPRTTALESLRKVHQTSSQFHHLKGQYPKNHPAASSTTTLPEALLPSPALKVKMLNTRKEFEKELGDFDKFRAKVREQALERRQIIREKNSTAPEPIDFEVVDTEFPQLEDNT